mgnify:FL=1
MVPQVLITCFHIIFRLFVVFKCLSKERTLKNFKAVDVDKLQSDLRNSELCLDPLSALDNLISCDDSTIADTLNYHARLKTRVMTVRSRLPWFNEDIREEKRARRKAEKPSIAENKISG